MKPPRSIRSPLSLLVLLLAGCSQRTTPESDSTSDDAGSPIEGTEVAPPATHAANVPTTHTEPSSPVQDQAPELPPACPADMVLVDGAYCPDVRHTCLQWMDPPGTYEFFRCARYGQPVCASTEKTSLKFCIDRHEYTEPGASLPAAHHSWTSAKATCEAAGKRLCAESEWQFACEGEEMRPYPYGFDRDATACNIDRGNLGKPNQGLRDLREPAGSHAKCVSPFGVFDMSGNVEEWATLDNPGVSHDGLPDRSTMKGAWWLPGRNTCRAATTGHGETYEGAQVGVRCCKDAG